MPFKNLLRVNFRTINESSKQHEAKLSPAERGFFMWVRSELTAYEQSVQKAFRDEMDLADDTVLSYEFYQQLYKQYQNLKNWINETLIRIADKQKIGNLAEQSTNEFKENLDSIRKILHAYLKLTEDLLRKRQHYAAEGSALPVEYQFCTLLGGKYYRFRQADDPFIGGLIDKDEIKPSNGFCGGEVIAWCYHFINEGAPQYPMVGSQAIHQFQLEQGNIRQQETDIKVEKSFNKLDLNDLVSKIDYKKVYYLSMTDIDSGHAVGFKKYKDGSFHFLEPNLGVLFFADQNKLVSWLGLYFSDLRACNFPTDLITLYEFKKDVALPLQEPTPNQKAFFNLQIEFDNTDSNNKMNDLLTKELEILLKRANPVIYGSVPAMQNYEALVCLLKYQVKYNTCPPFLETARTLLRYFESDNTDTDFSHYPEYIQKAEKADFRTHYPECRALAMELGREIRAKKTEKVKRDDNILQQMKELMKQINIAEVLLREKLSKLSDKVKTLDNNLEVEVEEYQWQALADYYERFMRLKLRNRLQYLINHAENADLEKELFNDVLTDAESILPGLTALQDRQVLLSDKINQHLRQLYAKPAIKQAMQLKTFLNKLGQIGKKYTSLNTDSFERYQARISEQLLNDYIDALSDNIKSLHHQIFIGAIIIDDPNKPIGSSNISFAQIEKWMSQTPPIVIDREFIRRTMLPPTAMSVENQKIMKTVFDLLIKNNGKQIKEIVQTFLDTLVAKYPVHAENFKKLSGLFNLQISRLQTLFADTYKGNNKELSPQYLVELLQHLFGNAIDQNGALTASPIDKILVHLKEPLAVVMELNNAANQFRDELMGIKREHTNAYDTCVGPIKNLVLDQQLRALYNKRVLYINDLFKTSKEQLHQFMNKQRTAEDLKQFMRDQFVVMANGEVDVKATLKEQSDDWDVQRQQILNSLELFQTNLTAEIARLTRILPHLADPFDQAGLPLDLSFEVTREENEYSYQKHLLTLYQKYYNDLHGNPPSRLGILLQLPSSLLDNGQQTPELTAAYVVQRKAMKDDFEKNSSLLNYLRIKKLMSIHTVIISIINKILFQCGNSNPKLATLLENKITYLTGELKKLNPDTQHCSDDDLKDRAHNLQNTLGIPLFNSKNKLIDKNTLLDDFTKLFTAQSLVESDRNSPRFFEHAITSRYRGDSPELNLQSSFELTD